jgi:hypothetical protein
LPYLQVGFNIKGRLHLVDDALIFIGGQDNCGILWTEVAKKTKYLKKEAHRRASKFKLK